MSVESSWIEVGVELHPEDKPDLIFRVTNIQETGNGARMVWMESTYDSTITHIKWETYLLHGEADLFLQTKAVKWVKFERVPVPGIAKTRYELFDVWDDNDGSPS